MAQLILPGDAGFADVLAGKHFSAGVNYNAVGTMPNKVGTGVILTPSGADQAIPQGYYGGAVGDGKVAAVVVPVANVLIGTTIAGQAGTMPNKSGASLGSGTTTGGVLGASKFDFDILLPTNGYMDTTTKVHQTLTNLIAANLLSGVTIPEISLSGTAINGAGMKHYAHGVGTTDGSGNANVSGLGFKPLVIGIGIAPAASSIRFYFDYAGLGLTNSYLGNANYSLFGFQGVTFNNQSNVAAFSINASGFSCYLGANQAFEFAAFG